MEAKIAAKVLAYFLRVAVNSFIDKMGLAV
jgi:hypothetical protein